MPNGTSVEALVDTGSEHSLLSKDTFDSLQLSSLLPTEFLCYGFSAQPPMPPLGLTPVLSARIGNFLLETQFFVTPLAPTLSVILGMDLINQAEILVANIPISSPEPSLEPEIDPLNDVSAEILQEPISSAEREKLLQIIQPLLVQNSSTASDFCTHPQALVCLPTGSAPPCYVKQYRILHALFPVAEETIADWKTKGIIVEAPVGCGRNSSLLVVSKKDLEGKPTKHRFCLDPRPINDLLPDDRFQIPLISKMFERTGGSCIFSSIDLISSYHPFPISTEDSIKTSFSILSRQLMFIGAHFGIKTLTSAFQRVMRSLFANLPFAEVYVDDLLIHSASLDLHIEHV